MAALYVYCGSVLSDRSQGLGQPRFSETTALRGKRLLVQPASCQADRAPELQLHHHDAASNIPRDSILQLPGQAHQPHATGQGLLSILSNLHSAACVRNIVQSLRKDQERRRLRRLGRRERRK